MKKAMKENLMTCTELTGFQFSVSVHYHALFSFLSSFLSFFFGSENWYHIFLLAYSDVFFATVCLFYKIISISGMFVESLFEYRFQVIDR